MTSAADHFDASVRSHLGNKVAGGFVKNASFCC